LRRAHSHRVHTAVPNFNIASWLRHKAAFGTLDANRNLKDDGDCNVKKILGLIAIAGLMLISVPSDRAQAMSLSNPATASTTRVASEGLTTDVHWRRFHGFHRHHRFFRHRFHRRHHF
jgi:hypothetical protein